MVSVVRYCFILIFVANLGCSGTTVSITTPTEPAYSDNNNGQRVVALKPVAKVRSAEQNSAQPTTGKQAKPDGESKELFVGWKQPQVVLAITGNQHGYLEPCGCTGLANQKGGLARRHSLFKQLAAKGWEVVPLDAGNQVRRLGRQAEIQFQTTSEALKKMNYRAVGLGVDDLQLSSSEVLAAIASDDGRGPFVSANIAVLDRGLMPQTIVVKAGNRVIGITSILGDDFRKQVTSDEVVQQSVELGLNAALAQLKQAKCDYRVLLGFESDDNLRALVKRVPGFDLVVASSGPSDPAFEMETIPGTKTNLVHTGVKGMYVCVLGLYASGDQPVRYQRVPLDMRFPDSPEMRELMANYQNQLEELGLAGLEVKPLPHSTGKTFVGTKVCGDCHTKAFEVWEKSAHAHATETLIHPKERSDVPRQFDPECLSCHVTGWEPQKFFPFKSGFAGVDATPEMLGNGCENCHGPGSAHVAAENAPGKQSAAALKKLRAEMRLPLAGDVAEHKCMECHDIDNSPEFHHKGAFEKYWQQIIHKGKD